jgi:hypothetical protein
MALGWIIAVALAIAAVLAIIGFGWETFFGGVEEGAEKVGTFVEDVVNNGTN